MAVLHGVNYDSFNVVQLQTTCFLNTVPGTFKLNSVLVFYGIITEVSMQCNLSVVCAADFDLSVSQFFTILHKAGVCVKNRTAMKFFDGDQFVAPRINGVQICSLVPETCGQTSTCCVPCRDVT
jgi:hypothetical protein